MNKMIFGIAGLSAVAVALVLVLGSTNNAAVDVQNLGPLRPADVPVTKILAGKPVSTAQEAASKVGYSVETPRYLPQGYQVQLTNADGELGIVTHLASPSAVSAQTTHSQFFMQQKGVLIFMEKNQPDIDVEMWMNSWASDHSAEFVSVNGLKGAVHPIVVNTAFDGEKIEAPAELVFVKDNVLIEIRGMLSTQELVKIAENL